MTDSTAERITLSATAQNLLRIVIASYFLAVGLNLIPGTDLTLLAAQVVPTEVAEPLSAMVVFALAFLVMIGIYMRPAALILGLMTLFASYLQMIELNVLDELGTFWRDLVLIAALMLTYTENAPRDYRMRRAIRRKVTPRRIAPVEHLPRQRPTVGEPLHIEQHAPASPARLVQAREKLSDPVDNIFADAISA